MGQLGKHVVLVERSERMHAGTCPNVGCVPTKALVHHSRKRRLEDVPQEWYERSVGEVQALTKLFRGGNYDGLNSMDTVTVITGTASFTDPHTVSVQTGDGRLTVTAETILINTGSEPVVLDIPDLRTSQYTVTSAELIDTIILPERLTINGGGYLGLEFASIYGQFGTAQDLALQLPPLLGRSPPAAGPAPRPRSRCRRGPRARPGSRPCAGGGWFSLVVTAWRRGRVGAVPRRCRRLAGCGPVRRRRPARTRRTAHR